LIGNNCYTQGDNVDNYYYDGSTFKQCSTGCKSCSGPSDTQCLVCSNDYFLFNDNSCIYKDSPPSGFKLLNGEWVPIVTVSCYETCRTCLTLGDITDHKCSNCKLNYYKKPLTNNCYNKDTPPDGYYYFTTLFFGTGFAACNSRCKTCNGNGINNCLSCNDAYTLIGNNCYTQGDNVDNYYYDGSSFKLCSTGCKSCSGPSDTQCLVCSNNYILFNANSCYQANSPPLGYTFITNQWKKCYSSCASCTQVGDSDNHKCSTCRTDYFKINLSNNCFSKLFPPDGYYFDTDGFKQCYNLCKTCDEGSNSLSNNCLSCVEKYGLANKDCYIITGTVSNYNWNSKYGIFIYDTCYESCEVCYGIGDTINHNCFRCKSGFFFKYGTKNCYKDSMDGYYLDISNNNWVKCDINCSSCINSYSCIICSDSYFRHPTSLKCTQNCGNGYFNDNINKLCSSCEYPCDNCENKTKCLSCVSPFIFDPTKNTCIKNCLADEYLDSAYNCNKCPEGCATCSNYSTCGTCKDSKILFNGSCIDKCSDGYYYNQVSKECKNCHNTCQTCIDDTDNCTKCTYNTFLLDGKCLTYCPINYYIGNDLSCKTCQQMGKFIYDGVCLDKCPLPLIPDSNGNCKTCKENGKYIFGYDCLKECPTGYIANIDNICTFNYINNSNIEISPTTVISDSIEIIDCDPQPCRNNGKCKAITNNNNSISYVCECSTYFFGKRCEFEFKNDQFLNDISGSQNLINVNNDLLLRLKFFETSIIKNPTVTLSNDQNDKISNFAEKLIDNNKNTNNVEINSDVLKIADIAINSNVKNYNSNSASDSNIQKVDSLKVKVREYVDNTLMKRKSGQFNTKQENINYSYDNFNIELVRSNIVNMSNKRMLNINNGLSYIDFYNCEKKIRDSEILKNDTDLLFRKIEYFDPNLNNTNTDIVIRSKQISFQFYNPDNYEMLNNTLCSDDKQTFIKYNIFINENKDKLNLLNYRLLKDENIDPYDPTSPGFNSRCARKWDPKYGADTTINYRRSNYYQNMTAVCSDNNCYYTGILDSNYVQCVCNRTVDDLSFFFKKDSLESVPTVNLGVVECPHIAFTRPAIHVNPGFYNGLLWCCFLLLGLIILIILRYSIANKIEINKLIDTDCITDDVTIAKEYLELRQITNRVTTTDPNLKENGDIYKKEIQNLTKNANEKEINDKKVYKNDNDIEKLEKKVDNMNNDAPPKKIYETKYSENISKEFEDEDIRQEHIAGDYYNNDSKNSKNENDINKFGFMFDSNENENKINSNNIKKGVNAVETNYEKLKNTDLKKEYDNKNIKYQNEKEEIKDKFETEKSKNISSKVNNKIDKFEANINEIKKDSDINKEYVKDKINVDLKIKPTNNIVKNAKNSDEINIKDININVHSKRTYLDYEKEPNQRFNGKITDTRSHFTYYLLFLKNEHIMFAPFFKTSLANPTWVRFTYLIMNWALLFTLNAMMFSDEYIDIRVQFNTEERNKFEYTLVYETTKVCVSLLITGVLLWIFMWIFKPRGQVYKDYNSKILNSKQTNSDISAAYTDLNRNMRIKHILLVVLAWIIALWGIYYVICFCGVYTESAKGWVYGAFWGLIFEFIILTFLYPLWLIICRIMVHSCKLDFMRVFLIRF